MFEQIKLSYATDGLEPVIDTATVETHYGKHHAAYTKTFNELVEKAGLTGKSAEEVYSSVEKIRNTALEFCAVHTLEYLHRAGRVKGSAAFFGNLFGVKPIIIADAEGNQAAYKKVKGRDASITEIVNLLKEKIRKPEEQTVFLAHADCSKEEVDALKARIEKEIPCKDIYVCYIGPIIGASVGPDAIAVFAFGEEVTFVGGEK